MEQYDPRIDAFIDRAADLAKPILIHLRQVVHQASPLIRETIKWGFPFFDHKGPVCNMGAFKQHCSFGFWKATLLDDPQGFIKLGDANAGSIGRITTLADLPLDEVLIGFIQQAIKLNEAGVKVVPAKAAAPKAEVVAPDYFIDQLNANSAAKEVFEKFSPSQKKEYIEWILDAKSEATRDKRMQTALEWIGEGKSRHWKYK